MPIRSAASSTSLRSSHSASAGASMRISDRALPAGGGRPSSTRCTSSASIHSAAGQMATAAAMSSDSAAAWIASSPPMLEPRTPIRRPSISGRAASHAASAPRSSITAVPKRPLGLAVAAVVERQRGKAVGDRRARVVGVVLLARAGAVQHHHRRPWALARGQPQTPRDAVEAAAFGWRLRRAVLHNVAAVWRLPLSATRTRSARASTNRDTSRSAAATWSSSPSGTGRRRTSTPRTTCAPGRGPTSRRSRPAPTTSR